MTRERTRRFFLFVSVCSALGNRSPEFFLNLTSISLCLARACASCAVVISRAGRRRPPCLLLAVRPSCRHERAPRALLRRLSFSPSRSAQSIRLHTQSCQLFRCQLFSRRYIDLTNKQTMTQAVTNPADDAEAAGGAGGGGAGAPGAREAALPPAGETPSGRPRDDTALAPVIPVSTTVFGMEWSAHGRSLDRGREKKERARRCRSVVGASGARVSTSPLEKPHQQPASSNNPPKNTHTQPALAASPARSRPSSPE